MIPIKNLENFENSLNFKFKDQQNLLNALMLMEIMFVNIFLQILKVIQLDQHKDFIKYNFNKCIKQI